MAGRIPREFIDDLLARADIVDVVDTRVKLKKAGKNHQACCPFHGEKTPSFTVSQEKQFFHCFGCGAHGNAISFLMDYEKLEFPEAVEELAQFYGVQVPREKGSQVYTGPQASADDYELMEQAARYFQTQLKQHGDKDKAIDYLKGRGLNGEIVKAFGIGYAPQSWDGLLKYLGKSPETRKALTELKLTTTNERGRTFDFFRDRIMFPIRDRRGRVIAFGGRVLDGEDKGPKYLNSPETRIFHKGSELYGFYEAKQANRKLDQVLIVEGYMDVVALGQYGINYAVATLGTATSAEHINTLFRATSRIVCCFDGDRAGRDAAWRALENALPAMKDGKEMGFLFLPDGEDPDSMVRQIGKHAFEAKLSDAMPLSRFLFENLMQRHHLSSTEGKAALKAEAQPLIDKVEGQHVRNMLTEELSRLTGELTKHQHEQQLQQANRSQKSKKVDFSTPRRPSISPVKTMLWLLLHHPRLVQQFAQINPGAIQDPGIKGLGLLAWVHQYCLANPDKRPAQMLEDFREHPKGDSLARLFSWNPEITDDLVETVYQESFSRILDWHLTNRMDALLAKSRLSGLSASEKSELNLLMKEQAR